MTARLEPTDCRHEPSYPDHETVVFVEHGLCDTIVHWRTERCSIESPHEISECAEFEALTPAAGEPSDQQATGAARKAK